MFLSGGLLPSAGHTLSLHDTPRTFKAKPLPPEGAGTFFLDEIEETGSYQT